MKNYQNRKLTSRYIKFLPHAANATVYRSILKSAPDSVIKSISNAALNAMRGDVALTAKQKSLFHNNQKLFKTLAQPKISVQQKRRKLLSQKGGAFPLIPILIGTVLGSLGSHFISAKSPLK